MLVWEHSRDSAVQAQSVQILAGHRCGKSAEASGKLRNSLNHRALHARGLRGFGIDLAYLLALGEESDHEL